MSPDPWNVQGKFHRHWFAFLAPEVAIRTTFGCPRGRDSGCVSDRDRWWSRSGGLAGATGRALESTNGSLGSPAFVVEPRVRRTATASYGPSYKASFMDIGPAISERYGFENVDTAPTDGLLTGCTSHLTSQKIWLKMMRWSDDFACLCACVAGLQASFKQFGPLRIEWPGKDGKHPRYPNRGHELPGGCHLQPICWSDIKFLVCTLTTATQCMLITDCLTVICVSYHWLEQVIVTQALILLGSAYYLPSASVS